MSDREAFVAAVAASPEDDLPRLVFADWLDENGDPERAEFVRVQCELAKPAVWQDTDFRDPLLARMRELLDAHRTRWMAPVAAALGFTGDDPPSPARAADPPSFWRRVYGRLGLSRGPQAPPPEPPVEEVYANYAHSATAQFTAERVDGSPRPDWVSWELARGFVDHIAVNLGRFPEAASLAELFRIEPVSGLDVLLTEGGESDQWRRLAGEHLNRVRTLRLIRVHPFGQFDPRALVETVVNSEHLAGVRRLELGGPVNPNPAWSISPTVVHSPLFRRLTHLTAERTPDLVSHLLHAPADAALRVLNLEGCGPVADLHRVPFRDRVEALILTEYDSDSSGLFRPGAAAWPRLRMLDLNGWRHDWAQAEVFSIDQFPVLRELFLGRQHLDPDGANALAAAPFLPQLEVLDLSNNQFGDLEALAIADRLDPKRVRHLDLTGNPLSQTIGEELVSRFGDRVYISTGNQFGNPGWG
ncbi:MAG: TIGR02996 domain-containing protein [Gemmataceae bacterium]